MFSKIPAFFSMPNGAPAGDAVPSFAGMPLVNPLLNDAQTNIENLDERISQLESVAQWLNMNLQLVNSTVQQLQVQKQTLQALAQWQALSKDALGELAKINPFAAAQVQGEHSAADETAAVAPTEPVPAPKAKAPRKKTAPKVQAPAEPAAAAEDLPVAFEKMAQTWWDGLQNQFAQLAQPMMDAVKEVEKQAEHLAEKQPTSKPAAVKKSPVVKKTSARPKPTKS